ncbi:hypothetical protein T4B_3715 [Trichinella pseudospiralis]|uniref:Uncharacterized protein n=1 Tax=Trichinella pseudospiralis TaxID=6337 RepID=A0A0V1JB17_TRIPS|nr:hypothetical protein T4B_3715 [Trichinella pseudospiralis]
MPIPGQCHQLLQRNDHRHRRRFQAKDNGTQGEGHFRIRKTLNTDLSDRIGKVEQPSRECSVTKATGKIIGSLLKYTIYHI